MVTLSTVPPSRRRRLILWIGGLVALLLAGAAGLLFTAGFFNSNSVYTFGIDGSRRPVAAVFFSGDMGLRMGLGRVMAPAMAAHGIPVYGVSSPAVFTRQRSQADVDALLATAIDAARARTGADRVVLMGQSFGSDILAAGLAHVSPERRAHVAAIVLVVPGRDAYFRADPTGLRYFGTPDAQPAHDVRTIDWAPVVCVYGAREKDSLCPALVGSKATVIELPGGHFLNHDDTAVVATVMDALHSADPGIATDAPSRRKGGTAS